MLIRPWRVAMVPHVFLLTAAILALFGCSPGDISQEQSSSEPQAESSSNESARSQPLSIAPSDPNASYSADVRQLVGARAQDVIQALKREDVARLAELVHPKKGLRLSPYAYVDLDSDVVLSSESLITEWREPTARVWGAYDGSGDPIELVVPEYFRAFVYDADFHTSPRVSQNTIIGRGNTTNNAREIYPDAIIVEYHFPGFDPDLEGMDWKSLRLVFEEFSGIWYLVGLIHDQWTI